MPQTGIAWIDLCMRILNLSDMPAADADPGKRPAFVSTQVLEADRYYLNLNPPRGAAMVVVCGGCERLAADYLVERSTFPYLCVEFVAEGAGTVELNGLRFPLRPGTAFAYASGIPHTIRNDPRRPMRKYYVNFAGKEAARLLAATLLGEWAVVQITSPQELLDVFDALQRDAFADGELQTELCAAHLKLLLLKIAHRALPLQAAEPRGLATYQRARRHIEKYFAELQTAEDVARGCHISPVHLSRTFQRYGQTTPYRFLMRLKMNRAAELLMASGMMVKEAADALGFSSQFQFSRAFKRVHGIAPAHLMRDGPRRFQRPA